MLLAAAGDKLAGEAKLPIDTDWLYRRPLRAWGSALVLFVNRFFERAARSASRFALDAQKLLANPVAFVGDRDRRTYDPDDNRPTIGVTALVALVVVGILALWVAG